MLSDKFSILQEELVVAPGVGWLISCVPGQKHQIMAMSQDPAVFTEDTPPRNWFFDLRVRAPYIWGVASHCWQAHVGSASKALEADEALAQLRHALVPARCTTTKARAPRAESCAICMCAV